MLSDPHGILRRVFDEDLRALRVQGSDNTGGGGGGALNDLTDVDTTGQANGTGLVFNGTLWVPVDVVTEAEKGVANGVASLDGNARVPQAQLASGTASAGFAPVSNGSGSTVWTNIASQAELDAHAGATTSVHGIADTSRLVAEDANGDITLDSLTLGGGGATVTGGVVKQVTALKVQATYTQTADPTDPALGSPFYVNWNPTLNYAGGGLTGPLPQTSWWGPRAVFHLEGKAQYNFSTTTFGLTPLPFGNFLIVKNQPGQAKSLTPSWQFVAAGIYMADGATVTAVQPDAAEGPAAFYDTQVFVTANTGTWNGTANDVKVISFISNPFVLGNSSLAGRVAFDVREINQYAHGNMGSVLDSLLTEDVDDLATPSVTKQIGLRIPRLTFATTNVGIECNSRIDLWRDTVTFTAEPSAAITLDGAFTFDFSNATWHGMLQASPTVTFRQAANVFGGLNIFKATPTITNTASLTGAILGVNFLFHVAPIYDFVTTNGAVTASDLRQFNAAVTLQRTTGANTFTTTALSDFASAPTVNTGVTLTTRRGLYVTDPGGSGTVTNNVGIDIANLTRGSGMNVSLRSAGASTQMRHAGPAVFGANAAPTNTSVGLEVQSTTRAFLLSRMTTTQRNAMTPVNGMVIYNTTANQVQAYVNGAWTAL